jgi:hypothetical protein
MSVKQQAADTLRKALRNHAEKGVVFRRWPLFLTPDPCNRSVDQKSASQTHRGQHREPNWPPSDFQFTDQSGKFFGQAVLMI